MKHRHIPKRRAAITGAGIAALVAAGVTFQTANASDAPAPELKTLTATAAGNLSQSLDKTLGTDAAGAYYDAQSKSLVVNVLDQKAADAVEQAGAKAKVVQHSLAELKTTRSDLMEQASTKGVSWALDPKTNRVVVTADRTVEGAALAKLTKATDALGSQVELRRSEGEFKKFIAGGDAIWGGTSRCSLGFNVTVGGEPHFLTAGHCTEAVTEWSDEQGGPAIGANAGSSFPDNDYGIVKYSGDTAHPSEVNLYNGSAQAIAKAGDATVGQQVQRSGSTTQVHDGEVTGLDATVDYGGGDVVNGLIQTNVCAEPGDSGGALFAGDTALGLTSGGSGNCSSGGETFFQPVPEALEAFGAEIG